MSISPCEGNAYRISQQGQELVSHGTPLFPAAFYNDDLERERVPWHWHEELEAVVVATGQTTVFVGKTHCTLGPGQGFFINANILHAAQGLTGTGCTYHSIVFHPRLVVGGTDSIYWQKYLRPLIGSGVKGFVLDGSQPWHQHALNAIENAWQAGAADLPGFEFTARAALSQLVFLLTQHLPEGRRHATEKARRDGDRLKQMLRYIHQNFAGEISVSDIARSATLSESECLRCFKSTIGVPPIQYVKRFRVQRAAELLSATDMKIAEIGAQCGFQDTSYFTRAFREIKGMTPGEYRQGAL